MKSSIIEFEPRIKVPEDKNFETLKYDSDNAYPDRIRLTAFASGVTKSCIDLYGRYIRGRGFSNKTFFKSIANRDGDTFDKILRKVSEDFALFQGFALHINYNALLEISEIKFLPFEFVRYSLPDDTGYIGSVVVYDDWARQRKRQIDKDQVKTYPLFNPKKEVVMEQINHVGGIENYAGQVYYYTGDNAEYPLSSIDAILNDCESDGELSVYKNRQVTHSFMASHIYVNKQRFADEKERESHIENLKNFQGSQNAGRLLHVELESEEQMPEIIKVDQNINDKMFEFTEKSVQANIVQHFRIPKILLGVPTEGALGDKGDREGAKTVYSDITEDERILMEANFGMLFENWHDQSMNPEKDFSIIPISGVSKDNSDKIIEVLANTSLTDQVKTNILIGLFGYTLKDAQQLTGWEQTDS